MSVTNRVNVMISTDPAGQGGVASVVKAMLADSFSADWQIRHIVSHRAGSKVSMIWIFLLALGKLTLLRLLHRPGIAHIHLASRGSFSRKYVLGCLASFLGFKIVLHLHGGEFDQFYHRECSSAKRLKVNHLFEQARKVVVLGEKWRKWVTSTFPKVRDVQIIYNSGPEVVPFHQGEARSGIVFLGKLVDSKGVPDLIKSLPAVIKKFPEVKLVFGGVGRVAEYSKLASSLAVDTHISFAGWIGPDEKYALLSSAAVFVLPSYNEAFPISILEAMACGSTIISTDVGGIPEAISHGVEGLIVAPGDISALSEAIIKILGDPVYANKLSDNAKHRYDMNFSRKAIMPLWQQLYTEILND